MSFKDFKKKTLRKSAAYNGISTDLRNIRKFLRDRKAPTQIKKYLDTHDLRKLQLGANRNGLVGWLNTDLHTIANKALALDVSKPFPIPDASIDFIFSEHLIEHLPSTVGAHMLKECRRILKPKTGVMRIATPDLEKLLALLADNLTEQQEKYIHSFVDLCLWDYTPYDGLEVINHAFKAWGHQFLYDEKHLVKSMHDAGFTSVKRCQVGMSEHPELNEIEHHGCAIENNEMNEYETMVFEVSYQ
ncbi:class I SAM-dependent methyltransferase [Terasakiella pusilla]|uniref:class I SAM-dependent methyltransferase n=1 Tax=Terasakiella pusilla TaxID=64973 RepID=UPI003AA7D3F3